MKKVYVLIGLIIVAYCSCRSTINEPSLSKDTTIVGSFPDSQIRRISVNRAAGVFSEPYLRKNVKNDSIFLNFQLTEPEVVTLNGTGKSNFKLRVLVSPRDSIFFRFMDNNVIFSGGRKMITIFPMSL